MADSNANLDHIFFFINNQSTGTSLGDTRDTSTAAAPTQCTSPHSETTSLASSDTEASNTTTSSGSSSSSRSGGLSPHAHVFTPKSTSTAPPTPHGKQLYEVRETSDRGYALFAATFIPLGTRIICESPLIRIPENQVHLAWGPYERLSNAKKAAFDKLHFYTSPHMDLEQASRTCLLDPNDTSLDEDDITELVANQVRVMGTFAANNFATGRGLSVFETAARINHSCMPNVHHSFNPTLQKQTVHAVRDIQNGEELVTTYLGGPGNYFVSHQRLEMLQESYGFACTCHACSDTTGQSDHRRHMLAGLAWGMQQYLEGLSQGEPAVPASPESALYQAEAMIHLLREEGLQSMELIKAYRTASMSAYVLRDYNKAIDYAYLEADVERNCLGPELDDLAKLGQGSAGWIANVRETAATFGVTVRQQKKGKKSKKGKKAPPEDQALKIDQKSVRSKLKKQARKEKNSVKLVAECAEREAKRADEEAERKKKEYEASWPGLKA
ncbi:hypothetical protein LTR08_009094 [Meristemomyces frigidus]|nr:hypothetical protein LTR08_009094 [Meristemomyces frigidus]